MKLHRYPTTNTMSIRRLLTFRLCRRNRHLLNFHLPRSTGTSCGIHVTCIPQNNEYEWRRPILNQYLVTCNGYSCWKQQSSEVLAEEAAGPTQSSTDRSLTSAPRPTHSLGQSDNQLPPTPTTPRPTTTSAVPVATLPVNFICLLLRERVMFTLLSLSGVYKTQIAAVYSFPLDLFALKISVPLAHNKRDNMPRCSGVIVCTRTSFTVNTPRV